MHFYIEQLLANNTPDKRMKKLFFSLFIILINYNQNAIGMEINLTKEKLLKNNNDDIWKKKKKLTNEFQIERIPCNLGNLLLHNKHQCFYFLTCKAFQKF